MIKTNGIFLIDNTDKVLLVHVTNGRWNQWSVPKGLTENKETSLDSTIRELKEETNINLIQLMNKYGYEYWYLGTQPYKTRKKQIEAHLFKINTNLSEMELDLKCTSMISSSDVPECDDFKWVSVESESFDYLHEAQVTLLNKHLNEDI